MKKQMWFETDLGYAATKEMLLKSRIIAGDSQDYGGRFTFWFINLKDFTIQITTKGKLGITYPETSNYNVVLDKLKPYLVRADNTPARILRVISNKASIKDGSSKLGFWGSLNRRDARKDRERDLRERWIDCQIDMLFEEMELDSDDPDYLKKINEIKLRKQREYGLIP